MELFFEGAVVLMKEEFAMQHNFADEGGCGILTLKKGQTTDALVVAMVLQLEENTQESVEFVVNWGNGRASICPLSHLKLAPVGTVYNQWYKTSDNSIFAHIEDEDIVSITIEEGLTLEIVTMRKYEESINRLIKSVEKGFTGYEEEDKHLNTIWVHAKNFFSRSRLLS